MFSKLYDDIKTTFINTTADKEYTESTKQVFDDYQKRVIIGFDTNRLNFNNTTISAALEGNTHGKLQVTTRPIFLKGEVESYDFCAELSDSTLPPYNTDCLQKEFLRVGGQQTGKLFPRSDTLPKWNSISKWLYVKQNIQTLLQETKSESIQVSEKAKLNLYGPKFDYPMTIERFPGVEVFWFTSTSDITRPTIFLGRRIRSSIPILDQDGAHSIAFFTSILVDHNASAQFLVTTNNAFALYFNNATSAVYNNKMVNTASEFSIFQKMGHIERTSSTIYLLPGQNTLSGYIFQDTGHYYKLEIHSPELASKWAPIPPNLLRLTQEPFAPMISFEVEPNYLSYGCDHTFCDKRLSGFKMKWENDGWGGPSRYYRGDSRDRLLFPLLKSFIRFPKGGVAIHSKFFFKLNSFMTLTMLINIKELPEKGTTATPLVLHGIPGYYPAIRISRLANGDCKVNVGTSMNKIPQGIPQPSVDGPSIEQGVPYLLVLRMLRRIDADPSSLYGIQIGAGKLWDLQENHTMLKESKPIIYINPIQLDDPASTTSKSSFYINSKNITFDLYWMHLFDYKLEDKYITQEASGNWKYSI